MDPRIANRRRKVQEEHSRKALKRIMITMLAAGLVSLGFWLLYSPYMSAKSISVSGVDRSSATDLLAQAEVVAGRPLVSIDPKAVRELLLTDPWIATARVNRIWPSTIRVTVSERWPVATLITEGKGISLVAPDGTVLSELSEPDPMLPIIEINRVDNPGAALNFAAALRPDLSHSTIIRVGDSLHATVMGYPVRLGRGVDMVAKANSLAGVLDSLPPPGSVITVIAPTRPAILTEPLRTDRSSDTEEGEETPES